MNATAIAISSWAPTDLTAFLDGTYQVQPPRIMRRTDGVALMYAAKVHGIHGEAESGKTLVALAVVAEELTAGHDVLFIDFESDQATVVHRLLMLGAGRENILGHLHYVRPDCHPLSLPDERQAWEGLLNTRYTLAVIDGVTEAFSVYGVKSIDNDEVTAWGRMVPRQIANRTGAAVAVIDHVTKDSEGRGRFAIGAQAKMSYLTGASYSVEVIQPIGVGMSGKLAIRVGKDRPGLVRPHGGAWRKGDRTQEIAVALIDSNPEGRIRYNLVPPRDFTETAAKSTQLEETMQAVAAAIQDAPTPPSFRQLRSVVRGNQDSITAAITALVKGQFIIIEPGPRNSKLHRSLHPYSAGTVTA